MTIKLRGTVLEEYLLRHNVFPLCIRPICDTE